ncbi:hypothetical protein BTA51_27520 [Hahella sp. CCB-MM4]|uniref:regulatory protein RecX n=1 Tax=Hahella sp. (strain CCB-MM4) TaxID=1926491 RepID=UPI000B9BF506|nr:regulatory protein RecX [Hahella sp. CCB-MM4]OZG70123.1 hypothetical protein BTA51_27520 [Hahella sp. CCB-MM4]
MTDAQISLQDVRNSALRLLARREHSEQELREKLAQRGATAEHLDQVIAYLIEGKYLCDVRYAEMIIRRRASQGYGLRKVSYELSGKGVSRHDIQTSLEELNIDWIDVAVTTLQKKFRSPPESPLEIQKYQKFLQQKGFDFDAIKAAMEVIR